LLDAPFADAGGKPVYPVNQGVPGRLFHHGSFGRMALSLPAWPSAVLPSATARRAFIARPPCSAVVSSAPTFNSITSPATSFIRQVSKCSGRPDGGFVDAVYGSSWPGPEILAINLIAENQPFDST
jgi:hypothetical protein